MKLPRGWRKRGRGIYWRHYVDGRQRETYLGTTLPAAHRRFADLIAERPIAVETVEDLLLRYRAVEAPKKAQATQDMIARAVERLIPVFGSLSPTDMTPAMLYQYHERRTAKTSAKHEIGVLKAAFSAAVRWGELDTNHLLGQTRIARRPPRDRYVTDDELALFIRGCTPWMAAYVGLKLLTGLAQEDLLSLTRDDVREDGLHARRRKTRAKAKVYPWDADGALQGALDAVSAAHRRRVGSRFLFHQYDGSPYYELDESGHRAKRPHAFRSAWARAMATYLKAGGVRFTEHDLRAKVASDVDVEHARALMDHTTAQITERVYRRAPKRVPIRGGKV